MPLGTNQISITNFASEENQSSLNYKFLHAFSIVLAAQLRINCMAISQLNLGSFGQHIIKGLINLNNFMIYLVKSLNTFYEK